MESWLNEKRKGILLNGVVFGLVAGMSSLATFLATGKTPDAAALWVVLGAFVGGIVGYINTRKEDLETGAAPGAKKKPGAKIGL